MREESFSRTRARGEICTQCCVSCTLCALFSVCVRVVASVCNIGIRATPDPQQKKASRRFSPHAATLQGSRQRRRLRHRTRHTRQRASKASLAPLAARVTPPGIEWHKGALYPQPFFPRLFATKLFTSW